MGIVKKIIKKKIFKRLAKYIIINICNIFIKLFGIFLIPIFKYMAVTGEGTDKCMALGFLPVPIHFYQPIPDINDLEKRKIWNKVSKLNGIKFEPSNYIKYITELAKKYAAECDWPNEPSVDPNKFYLHNGCFSYGCAASLHCIIRDNKPKRIIEIGSGNSSKVIAEAIYKNFNQGFNTKYTIIDPYISLNKQLLPLNFEILKKQVEVMDLKLFKSLGNGDILFIDSSHVCKIGSDVNFEILEILPILAKGVYIHFHDINLPNEYPKIYATNPNFRVFWTESYLLQAFLTCNREFEIILPMAYLQQHYLDKLKNLFPNSTKTELGWVSGSFWIKRKN